MKKSGEATTYFGIAICMLSSCWMDFGRLDDGIKIINSSDKNILIYIDNHANTGFGFDKYDSSRIYSVVTDSFSSGYGTIINLHSVGYVSTQDYRNKSYWECCVPGGKILLALFDKRKLLGTKNIDSSKLEFIYLTYDELIRDSCVVTYRE